MSLQFSKYQGTNREQKPLLLIKLIIWVKHYWDVVEGTQSGCAINLRQRVKVK